jgi:hypothetical protein
LNFVAATRFDVVEANVVGFALGVGVEGTALFAAEGLLLAVLRFGGMAYVNGGRERSEIYV